MYIKKRRGVQTHEALIVSETGNEIIKKYVSQRKVLDFTQNLVRM